MTYLVRALFAREGVWAPYHDRIAGRLGALDAQGWASGSLQRTLFELVRRRAEAEDELLRTAPADEDIARRAFPISQTEDAGTPDENWARAQAELRQPDAGERI